MIEVLTKQLENLGNMAIGQCDMPMLLVRELSISNLYFPPWNRDFAIANNGSIVNYAVKRISEAKEVYFTLLQMQKS